jgi:hypothetical protein
MATDRAPGLRRSTFEDPALSENMRDVDDYMRGTLRWLQVPQFDTPYTEPLHLSLEDEPVGVVCVRVRQILALTTPLLAGGVCPFVWDGKQRRVSVSKVPGLTVGTGAVYRFDFAVVG